MGTASNEGGGGGFGGGGGEGSHTGHIQIQLSDNTTRDLSSAQVLDLWREEAGEIPGVESLQFKKIADPPGISYVE